MLDQMTISYTLKLSSGSLLVKNAYLATSILSRLKGLLGRNELPSDEALVISPCNSIHTFGMKFPIDVVFLDKNNTVTGYKMNVRPNRVLFAPKKTRKTIELASDTLAQHELRKNLTVGFERNGPTSAPTE